MKTWHIENLIEAEDDIQVVPLRDVEELLAKKNEEINRLKEYNDKLKRPTGLGESMRRSAAYNALWDFDEELGRAALQNGWDTDSDAYYVSQLLRSFADGYKAEEEE